MKLQTIIAMILVVFIAVPAVGMSRLVKSSLPRTQKCGLFTNKLFSKYPKKNKNVPPKLETSKISQDDINKANTEAKKERNFYEAWENNKKAEQEAKQQAESSKKRLFNQLYTYIAGAAIGTGFYTWYQKRKIEKAERARIAAQKPWYRFGL
ncbi:MAG TPA: hypothetical protein VEK38_01395 [Candidatus Bathyarchaeia archaeon]|nr:hypothetical protein [Candidatus Bathyarchaeia archaeon]